MFMQFGVGGGLGGEVALVSRGTACCRAFAHLGAMAPALPAFCRPAFMIS